MSLYESKFQMLSSGFNGDPGRNIVATSSRRHVRSPRNPEALAKAIIDSSLNSESFLREVINELQHKVDERFGKTRQG